MQFSIAAIAIMAVGVFAAPAPSKTTSLIPTPTVSLIPFGTGNPVVNSTCPKIKPNHQPLKPGFPLAHQLGSIIGPVLAKELGNKTLADIDEAADELCVSAEQSGEGTGVCQETFAACRALVNADDPLQQSKQFGCLLNLLCIAPTGPNHPGTCNYLLAGADCVANRIIGLTGKDAECTKQNN